MTLVVTALGLLPPYLARQVGKFYVQAKSVIEDFALLGESTRLEMDIADRIEIFERLATLIEDTTNLGHKLILQLDAFAAGPPSPWRLSGRPFLRFGSHHGQASRGGGGTGGG